MAATAGAVEHEGAVATDVMPELPIEARVNVAAEDVGADEDLAGPQDNFPASPDCGADFENPVFDMDGNPCLEFGPEGTEGDRELAAQEASKLPPRRLVTLLCMVGGLEGADGVLLPCVFYALQRDLGLTLNDLAVMSMVQALAGSFASPVWGVLADRGTLQRKSIIVLGCVVQGVITCILAGVDKMIPMLVLRALNGVFLASLRPIANGIIADVTAEMHRGKVYGSMGIAMNVGTMAGTLVATNLGPNSIQGFQGWRIAFMIVGSASVVVGCIAGLLMKEPPKAPREEPANGATGCSAIKAEFRELCSYFRMPSFCVLILQGCFGTVPWNALGYKTLFFQLSGITNFQASIIDVCSQISGSIGGLLGGIIGDNLSRCSKYHGRPLTAQISVLAGIPVAWFIFMTRAPESCAFAYYLLLMVCLGLTATWCGVGVNLPILSEIVKDDRRATIMAWEGSLESSCSAIFGNAAVGFLAQNLFGCNLGEASEAGASASNVKALGTALMMVSFVPWVLCFITYTLLHWSYARDLRWLAAQDQQRRVETLAAKAAAASAAIALDLKGDPSSKAGVTRPSLSTAAAQVGQL